MINNRSTLVAAAAIATSICMQSPESAASAAQPGSWGVNVGAPFRGAGIKNLGAQWVRVSIAWSQVEGAAKGSYDWGQADKTVNYYLGNGFHVICILSVQTLAAPYSASALISLYRSDLPSKPMPDSSGMVMWPFSTRTPSGKPP